MDTNAKLQKLISAIGKHGCPTCRGCTIDPKTKEACKGCGGTGKGIDWAMRVTQDL